MTVPKYRVLIIGAGGFGREVLAWIKSFPASIQLPKDEWYIGGFLDDNSQALDQYNIKEKIIGKPLEFEYQPEDRLICTIAEPHVKLKLCRQLEAQNRQFVNMFCDRSILERDNIFGKGIIMVPGANMTTNITVGNYVTLNGYATVGHDVIIGDGCTINSHVDITGAVVLHEGVFIGTHATIIPTIHVGEYARIGAGSVVVRPVSPYTTVMGVPAKKLFSNIPNANNDVT